MIHEFGVGGWRAVVLHDEYAVVEATQMITNWPPERIEREFAALGGGFPQTTIGNNVLAVQTPGGWVLMDGGQAELTGNNGQLLSALAEAGIAPEDISLVFVSHAHMDHFGGLVSPQTGALTFPNARYVMSGAEWDFWFSEAVFAEIKRRGWTLHETLTARLKPIEPRLTKVAPGDVFAPGMTAVEAVGHTQGHTAVLIEHGGDAVLYIGDAAVHPAHFKYPDAAFYNDNLPGRSPETRRALLRLAREKRATILACHFAFPGMYDVPDTWPVEEES